MPNPGGGGHSGDPNFRLSVVSTGRYTRIRPTSADQPVVYRNFHCGAEVEQLNENLPPGVERHQTRLADIWTCSKNQLTPLVD